MKASRNTFSERSLHGRIAHDLGKKIIKGHFRPDDILPNETQLCRDLEVSRTAVREAFKVLSSKGLLESRPKVGTRVRSKQDWNLLDPDILDWVLTAPADVDLFRSLIETQKIIIPQAAKLAARCAGQEKRDSMNAAWEHFSKKAYVEQELIDASITLQLSIVSATENPFISNLGNLLITSLGQIADAKLWHESVYDELHSAFKSVMENILSGNQELAEQSMHHLLQIQPHTSAPTNTVATQDEEILEV